MIPLRSGTWLVLSLAGPGLLAGCTFIEGDLNVLLCNETDHEVMIDVSMPGVHMGGSVDADDSGITCAQPVVVSADLGPATVTARDLASNRTADAEITLRANHWLLVVETYNGFRIETYESAPDLQKQTVLTGIVEVFEGANKSGHPTV